MSGFQKFTPTTLLKRFLFPEHRNEAENSFAKDPAAVGQLYKDLDEDTLNAILKYYEKDFIYLGYGLDRTNWALTF